MLIDPRCDLEREEALSGREVGGELADLDEQTVVESGSLLVVRPQLRELWMRSLDLRTGLVELGHQPVPVRRCQTRVECVERSLYLSSLTGQRQGDSNP